MLSQSVIGVTRRGYIYARLKAAAVPQ
jgi:hypothetical protein